MLNDNPYVGAVGRLLIAGLFLISGLGKIAAPALTQGFIASAGLPFPLLAYLVAIVIEVGGGILLILGSRSGYLQHRWPSCKGTHDQWFGPDQEGKTVTHLKVLSVALLASLAGARG